MARLKFEQSTRFGTTAKAARRDLDATLLIVLAAVPAVLIVWLVPPPLGLPALSAVSFAIAGCSAVLAYHSGTHPGPDALTLWDVAGVYALIWIGAGTFSDPEHVIQLFDQIVSVW